MEKWLTAHVLSNVEAQGIRKFIVSSTDNTASAPAEPQSALNIWVFAPDLTISSSALGNGKPTRVAKIMWKDCEAQPSAPEKLNTHNLFEGDIQLPLDEVQQLRSLLEASSSLLPASTRKFQAWTIGLLRRFTQAELPT
jgi:hypothetical protein